MKKNTTLLYLLIHVLFFNGSIFAQTSYSFTGGGVDGSGSNAGHKTISTNPTGANIEISDNMTFDTNLFYPDASGTGSVTFTIKGDGVNTESFDVTDIIWGNYTGSTILDSATKIVFTKTNMTTVTWSSLTAAYQVAGSFTTANQSVLNIFTGTSTVTNVTKIEITADFQGSGSIQNFEIRGISLANITAPVSNTAPVIAGTSANQAVNDNSTLSPFSTITTTDVDGDNLTATITLDTNAKGVLSGTDLIGTGPYSIASSTPSALQAKLRALIFNPIDNRTSTTETTTFTVVVNDGTDADTDTTTTVVSSAVAPTLNSSSPTDDATGVTISQNILLTFNEDISKGTGNILLKKTLDNSTVETIDITTALVTVSTNIATINPSSDFDLNTGYYIQIDNTTFKDSGNKNYTGISDAVSLNFTSEANQTNSYTAASGHWSATANWSLGRLPISTDNVDIATNNIILDISNVIVNDLSISIGGTFNILSSTSITVNGNLNQNGTLNMLSNASNSGSLIVKGNHTGISNVDYHRYLSTNWHLISAPISGKNISDFSGNVNTSGNKYAIAPYVNNVVSASRWNYYTTGAGANNIATAGTFTVGKGYSIQKGSGGTLNFSGTLNTTDKILPITDGGDDPAGNRWNLVGNPYTASLNGNNAANATNNFLKVNIDAGNLDPSRAGLYLWNGTTYVEKSVDDAAFYIAPGQGFFVHAPDAGGTSVSFTEDMQTHQTGNIFLRNNGISYPEIILNVTEDKNFTSTKIRYIGNKTKGLDPGSDIGTFTGTSSSFKAFTHLISDSKGIDFAIQALPNTDYEKMIIPVGLIAKAGKDVTFSIDAKNLPNEINIYLEDRLNNTFVNLSEGSNTITLQNDIKAIGRFYLHTTSQKLESIELEQTLENISIYKSSENTLTIAGLRTKNASLNVYSILGKKVISTQFNSTGVHAIQLPKIAKGVYIIELNSDLGKINKKIILE